MMLAIAMGACVAAGGDILTDAFGVVALVALTPLIAIQLMGILYQFKLRAEDKVAVVEETEILAVDAMDDIIEF